MSSHQPIRTPCEQQKDENMKPYEYLEHTADMGLKVFGEDLTALLTNAAQGLFETIAVVDTIDETASVQIHVTAESVEELFVAWLDELNFRHETEAIFFKRAHISHCSETAVSAEIYGEPANFDKHEVYTEIKKRHLPSIASGAECRWQVVRSGYF